MIDKVYMNQLLPLPVAPELLAQPAWHHSISKQGQRRVEFFIHVYKGLRIFYVPDTRRLVIRGRLMSASVLPDFIANLDAPYVGLTGLNVTQSHRISDGVQVVDYGLENVAQDLDDLVLDVNQYLTGLIGQPVDIAKFQVTYLEICFNTYTDHVDEYIQLFNLVFQKRGTTQYKNYVIERKAPPYSSYYVRGRVQFDKCVKHGFTVNFYNKADWLKNQYKPDQEALQKRNERWQRMMAAGLTLDQVIAQEPQSPKRDEPLPYTLTDIKKARRDLRLEVQIGFRALRDHFGSERPFRDFLQPDDCRSVIVGRYESFIGPASAGFCSYGKAMAIVDGSNLSNTVKRNLLAYLLRLQQGLDAWHHGSTKHNRMLADLGIHWCLIPAKFGIDYLEPPMALLDRAIEEIERRKEAFPEQMERNRLEVAMYDAIEVSDDDVCQVDPKILH